MSDHEAFTHLDDHGQARMVNVTGKAATPRRAVARATVRTTADVAAVFGSGAGEPDLIVMARVAAMEAAKRTWDLIPLCHVIHISKVIVEITPGEGRVEIEATTEVLERTGVEIEALTACAVAGLVIVNALREEDPWASIDDLALWSKEGGRSGLWLREEHVET